MATDIATLGIEIKATGAAEASSQLKQLTQNGTTAEAATSKLSAATNNFIGYVKAAAAALALYKLYELAKDAALTSARFEVLGVVMNNVGSRSGYTSEQMAKFEKKLTSSGIAMLEARQVLTQMAQAHLDLSKSAELSRVAQDAATTAGINSSEAFERMVSGIQKGESEMLRPMGIIVNFETAYAKLALTLGKSSNSLNETEKTTARMNAVLEAGTGITGTYTSAMELAGKQITSMPRYLTNLKVMLGSVFNDALNIAVGEFTKGLKDANGKVDEMKEKDQLAAWGKQVVMAMAMVADSLTVVYKILSAVFIAQVGLATSVYYTFKSVTQAYAGDFDAAAKSAERSTEALSNAFEQISEQFKGDWYNKYTKMADEMYKQRDASKQVVEQKKKEQEAQNRAAGKRDQEERDAEQVLVLVQKHREEWNKLIVTQMESTGQYEAAAQKQVELNRLTTDYAELQSTAQKNKFAKQALDALELTNQQKIFEGKRKELELETTHLTTMQGINSAKLIAKGISSEEVSIMTQRETQLLEERKIQDQIATEINPKKKTQLQEQLTAQQSLNYYLRQQSELELQIIRAKNASSALNDATKLALATNNAELAKSLAMENTRVSYEQKRAELQKSLNSAIESDNGTQANAVQQSMQQLDILYSQRDTNAANLKILQDYLSVQSGVTGELQKQAEFGGGKQVKDAQGNDVSVSQAFDSTNASDRTLYNAYISNMRTVMQSGLDGGYGMSMWKLALAESSRLTELANQKMLDEQIAANAKIVTAMENVAGDLSSAAADLAKSGQSMAESLRSAANKITDAQINLATSDTSTLSPEQQLALARQTFLNTAAKAQQTGDVDLYNQLPTLAQNFLKLSQSYNASGTAFTADYDTIQKILAESAAKANTQATAAEQTVSLLQKQADLLTKIKEALTTGGDTTKLLSDLYIVNGNIKTVMDNVNTGVGQTTAAAIATNTTTGNVVTEVGNNNTLTSNGTNSLASWLQAVNTNNTNISTYTSGMKDVLNGSLLSSQIKGRVASVQHRAAAGGSTSFNADETYTYYAKGGIANDPSGRSIFGEAGPEAAVPLPDGRSIPVTLLKSNSADNHETVAELKQANAELKAAVRVLQAGFNALIDNSNKQARSMDNIKNTARLAANQ